MNYKETLEWLFAQLPMYQREGKAAYKANLDNTLKLDEHFGSPHKQFKTIHVGVQTVRVQCLTCWPPYYKKPGIKPDYTRHRT